ncbi:uroporphyrinogen decarboxylase family protein [Desulfosporosinus sp. BICA1-9]|uniref:uroporphyrinogen decarboxylase family protein n=1 Tax=Desulfosporosinus sp. BICA1-9 TaxID=1531958 RepID=UPI00061E9467|nr:uroporphyrinogen decarboxylase family protein [Desulfosporosinus sp. BICA1-9]KJS46554.1 MAG: uroporphyrinogen decarboxylase [Peptococcaceae bacterium BRH_c23]HBW34336.1 uroporphyrinogen decarboxylase [Desulfosporosinus sp.]
MNEKERLLSVLKGDRVDRPPVICPGGMMSACVTELSDQVGGGHHTNARAMVSAARKINELIGFENYGVPFCLTAEVEALGAIVNLGDNLVEPRVTQYNDQSLEAIIENNYRVDVSTGRMGVVLEAVRELSSSNNGVPVIGNVSGHISTATSVVEPLEMFKMLRWEPERAARFLAFTNDYLVRYALEMVRAGADVISISDPTATGEILGPRNFQKFAVPFYQTIIKALHKEGVPVILHICGNASNIIDSLNQVEVNAVSFDSIVNMKTARKGLKTGLMGNVNTQLLHTGVREKIVSITRNALHSEVDIVAPACGLSMATPIGNLKAMTDYVKEGSYH